MKYAIILFAAMVMLLWGLEPSFAQATGTTTAIDSTLQAIIDLASGKTVTLIATLALIFCGYMLIFQQADMMRFGSLFLGIAIVMAAAQIAALSTKV